MKTVKGICSVKLDAEPNAAVGKLLQNSHCWCHNFQHCSSNCLTVSFWKLKIYWQWKMKIWVRGKSHRPHRKKNQRKFGWGEERESIRQEEARLNAKCIQNAYIQIRWAWGSDAAAQLFTCSLCQRVAEWEVLWALLAHGTVACVHSHAFIGKTVQKLWRWGIDFMGFSFFCCIHKLQM